MSKPILLEIDNVRIGRWDKDNLFVERLETYRNFNNDKKKWETITGYRFKGYYSTLTACLYAIYTNDLLINEGSVSDLNSLLKEIENSKQEVLRGLEEIKA